MRVPLETTRIIDLKATCIFILYILLIVSVLVSCVRKVDEYEYKGEGAIQVTKGGVLGLKEGFEVRMNSFDGNREYRGKYYLGKLPALDEDYVFSLKYLSPTIEVDDIDKSILVKLLVYDQKGEIILDIEDVLENWVFSSSTGRPIQAYYHKPNISSLVQSGRILGKDIVIELNYIIDGVSDQASPNDVAVSLNAGGYK